MCWSPAGQIKIDEAANPDGLEAVVVETDRMIEDRHGSADVPVSSSTEHDCESI
jgi:hypothetical protein